MPVCGSRVADVQEGHLVRRVALTRCLLHLTVAGSWPDGSMNVYVVEQFAAG